VLTGHERRRSAVFPQHLRTVKPRWPGGTRSCGRLRNLAADH